MIQNLVNKPARVYRPDIDGLRAIAVLVVILYHLELTLFSGGFVGVDVFFVISGYLITNNILSDINKGQWSFSRFYVRRIRRLFPALFATLIICLIFSFLLFVPEHFERFGKSLMYSVVSLSNVFFWMESGYFDASSEIKPLLHMWSLAVEEQFYFLWPALLVFLMGSRLSSVISGVMLVLFVITLIMSEVTVRLSPESAFFLTPFRIYEFCIGAILATIPSIYFQSKRISDVLYILGLSLILLSVFYFDSETMFPGVAGLIPTIGAALVIYSHNTSGIGAVLNNRVMVGIGLISYSLYLVHWPLIVYIRYWNFGELSNTHKLYAFISTFVLAFVMYKFIEKPFRYKAPVSDVLSPAKVYSYSLMFVLATVLVASSIWGYDGWHWRIPGGSASTGSKSALVQEVSYSCLKRSGYEGCFIGNTDRDSLDMLIIGDSTAHHLLAGFDKLTKDLNMKAHYVGGLGFCSPLMGSFRWYDSEYAKRKFKYEDKCKSSIQNWQMLIKSGNYKYVVISSRWEFMFEDIDNRPKDYLVDSENPVPDVDESRRIFYNKLNLTSDVARRSGSKLIVFSSVPIIHGKFKECQSKPYLYKFNSKQNMACATKNYNQVLQRIQFTNDTIRRIEEDNPGQVLSIIPSDVLCDDERETCRILDNGGFLYKDASHLSDFGSVYFIERISSKLTGFFSGRST